MFNSLSINSAQLSMLRCKQCKSILLGMDSITQYLSYDPDDFGVLYQYSKRKKFEGQASFLLLQSSITMYSSFKIEYDKSIVTDYHPFFMMHMFYIECAKCSSQIGYQVQTVNPNTSWMQGRFLIDASKCSMIKEGKDEMPRLIKLFKLRLAKKLQNAQNSQKNVEPNQEIVEKLLKMKIPNKKATRIVQKNQKDLFIEKNKADSVRSTNIQTNLVSKQQDIGWLNSSYESTILKLDDISYEIKNFQPKLFKKSKVKSSILQAKLEKVQKQEQAGKSQKEYTQLKIAENQREKMIETLKKWSQEIKEKSRNLESKQLVDKILKSMDKIDNYYKFLQKNMIVQHLDITKTISSVRKNIIQNDP